MRGIVVGGVAEYLGIPYAAAPVGSLRWQPPQLPAKFHDVLPAVQFGSACPQLDSFGVEFGSEDCLFLNVYIPRRAVLRRGTPHRLPVMVWIHGGGLTAGSGEFYDPTPLVKRGVIVVTINYRLGLLGFFAQTALDAEGHE
ncbi:MAG: carboxylesterase family protein, partial [Candidatus Binataceae bacterium]